MAKRIITVIADSDGDSICEGDEFISGLTRDELIGRLSILIVTGKAGLSPERKPSHRDPVWWEYHPLRHGGSDPKLGTVPTESEAK